MEGPLFQYKFKFPCLEETSCTSHLGVISITSWWWDPFHWIGDVSSPKRGNKLRKKQGFKEEGTTYNHHLLYIIHWISSPCKTKRPCVFSQTPPPQENQSRGWRVPPRFHLKISAQLGWASSNMNLFIQFFPGRIMDLFLFQVRKATTKKNSPKSEKTNLQQSPPVWGFWGFHIPSTVTLK